MIISFIISFIKELIGTINTKLYIAHKDVLAGIGCGVVMFIGSLRDSIIFGIPITSLVITKASLASIAVTSASILAIPLFNKLKLTEEKDYEFIIRFKDTTTCKFMNMKLKEQKIQTYFKEDSKKLIVDSHNKRESEIIWETIKNEYKSVKINEVKVYKNKN